MFQPSDSTGPANSGMTDMFDCCFGLLLTILQVGTLLLLLLEFCLASVDSFCPSLGSEHILFGKRVL